MVNGVNCREFETKRKLRKNISNMLSCMKVGYIIAGYLCKVLCLYPWWWPFSKANDHGEFLIFTWWLKTTDNLRNGLLEESCRKFVCDKRNRLAWLVNVLYVGIFILSFRQIPAPADYLLPWRSTWDELPIVVVYLDCIYRVMHFDWLWPPIEPKFTFRGLFV